MNRKDFEILMNSLFSNNQLFIPQGQTIEEWIDNAFINEEKEAINYTHSCESDSEQLVCNYCLEKTNTLPDDFGCQSCIDNYK
jgi:hypothetical protein